MSDSIPQKRCSTCIDCGAETQGPHCPTCYRARTRANTLQWQTQNPDRVRAYVHAARARKLGLTEHFSPEEWRELCKRYGDVCLRCRQKKPLTPDHVIPLGQEGATNTIDNIQPLCRPCNTRKGTKSTDYRIDAPTFDLPTTFLIPKLMSLPGGTLSRFLKID